MVFRIKMSKKAGLGAFCSQYFVDCRKEFYKSLILSAILTLILIIVYVVSDLDGYDLLNNLLSISIKVSPPLLAFTLAGYSVIMGKNAKSLRQYKAKSGLTMFQQLNTTFIAMLLSALVSLIITVVLSFIVSAELTTSCKNLADFLNFIAFALVSFFLSYTLFAVKDLISNLFSMGQYINKAADKG